MGLDVSGRWTCEVAAKTGEAHRLTNGMTASKVNVGRMIEVLDTGPVESGPTDDTPRFASRRDLGSRSPIRMRARTGSQVRHLSAGW